MKKRIFAALLSGIMVMGMSGSSMTALAEENNSEQVVLRWFTKVENDAEAGQWKELADDVTDLYPNIKVEFEYTDWNGYWTKLPVDLASGDAPDIVYMHAMRAKDYLGDSFVQIGRAHV